MNTSTAPSEQALHRVLRYLELSGVTITVDAEKQALALVIRALDADPADTFATSMGLIPLYFELPRHSAPRQSPPLCRGSLGYGDY